MRRGWSARRVGREEQREMRSRNGRNRRRDVTDEGGDRCRRHRGRSRGVADRLTDLTGCVVVVQRCIGGVGEADRLRDRERAQTGDDAGPPFAKVCTQ